MIRSRTTRKKIGVRKLKGYKACVLSVPRGPRQPNSMNSVLLEAFYSTLRNDSYLNNSLMCTIPASTATLLTIPNYSSIFINSAKAWGCNIDIAPIVGQTQNFHPLIDFSCELSTPPRYQGLFLELSDFEFLDFTRSSFHFVNCSSVHITIADVYLSNQSIKFFAFP